jgi:hypothetical protein
MGSFTSFVTLTNSASEKRIQTAPGVLQWTPTPPVKFAASLFIRKMDCFPSLLRELRTRFFRSVPYT